MLVDRCALVRNRAGVPYHACVVRECFPLISPSTAFLPFHVKFVPSNKAHPSSSLLFPHTPPGTSIRRFNVTSKPVQVQSTSPSSPLSSAEAKLRVSRLPSPSRAAVFVHRQGALPRPQIVYLHLPILLARSKSAGKSGKERLERETGSERKRRT